MKEPRFRAGQRFNINGRLYRTVEGTKFPGDLVMQRLNGTWMPVLMPEFWLEADFLAWNEQQRSRHESFWRQNGDRYFLASVISAVRDGWRVPTERLERDKRRRIER